MTPKRIDDSKLSIRIDPLAEGQWCSVCNEVQAEKQPEMFVREGESYRFICKLCAWDHAPWLVSLINMGHYSDWEAWGGEPPTPEKLADMGLTVTDMLGEEAQREAPELRSSLVNQHTAMLAAYVEGGSDQPFAGPSPDNPDAAVYVIHNPPARVGLDECAPYGDKAGSEAVYNFIRTGKPLLSLHGHIHECADFFGKWRAEIGPTLCVQPGQLDDLAYVLINLKTMECERHTETETG